MVKSIVPDIIHLSVQFRFSSRKPGTSLCVNCAGPVFRGPNALLAQKVPYLKATEGGMSHYKKEIPASAMTLLSEEPVPPLRPAPMPRQTIVFWTPRVVVAAASRVLLGLFRLQRARLPAVIPMRNSDES
jgi:hypothetical protein